MQGHRYFALWNRVSWLLLMIDLAYPDYWCAVSRSSRRSVMPWDFSVLSNSITLSNLSTMPWWNFMRHILMLVHKKWSPCSFMRKIWVYQGIWSIYNWPAVNLTKNHRNIVVSCFATYEAGLVCAQKACWLQWRQFWAAGVNDLFAVDQHDKWLRFGLALHTGIEPFSGCIMWIRVWHSNHNPQLILTYYLDTIEKLGRKFILNWYLWCNFTQCFTRHSNGHSEWSRIWELWDHQCAHYAASTVWSITPRHVAAPVDAHQEECHAWDRLVSITPSVCAWLWNTVRRRHWEWLVWQW